MMTKDDGSGDMDEDGEERTRRRTSSATKRRRNERSPQLLLITDTPYQTLEEDANQRRNPEREAKRKKGEWKETVVGTTTLLQNTETNVFRCPTPHCTFINANSHSVMVHHHCHCVKKESASLSTPTLLAMMASVENVPDGASAHTPTPTHNGQCHPPNVDTAAADAVDVDADECEDEGDGIL